MASSSSSSPSTPEHDPTPVESAATPTLATEPVGANPPVGVPAGSTAPAPAAPAPAAPAPAAPVVSEGSRVRAGAVPFLLGALAVVLVVVLAGGTSWVVARAAAAAPLSAPTAAGHPDRAAAHGTRVSVVRGKITELGTGSWTIETGRGETVTVSIGQRTRFVHDGSAVAASSFHVGDTVVVAGARSGSTLAARRIAIPTPHPPASPSDGA